MARRAAVAAAAGALAATLGLAPAAMASGAPSVGDESATSTIGTQASLSAMVNPEGYETSVTFEWGLSPGLGSQSGADEIGSGSSALVVDYALAGLTPGATYDYRVVATSAAGATDGATQSFVAGSSAPVTTTTMVAGEETLVPTTLPGFEAGETPQSASCPLIGPCVAVISLPGAGQASLVDGFGPTALETVARPTGISLVGRLSCVTTGLCVMVGARRTGATSERPAAERGEGATWRSIPPVTPAGATADTWLADVSCTSARFCLAVGGVDGGTAAGEPLVERYNGSSWSVVAAPAPGDSSFLEGVSCASATSCWAVGTARGFGPADDLLVHYTGSRAVSVAVPGGLRGGLAAVDCVSASWCVAVGSRETASHNDVASSLFYRSGAWRAGPAPIGGPGVIFPSAVSCISALSCWEVGTDGSVASAGVIAHWGGVSWGNDIVSFPSGDDSSLTSVACYAGGPCLVLGVEAPHRKVQNFADATPVSISVLN